MATPLSPSDLRLGIAEQSTFGTGVADSGAFTELSFEQSPMEPVANVREIPGGHATRQKTYADQHNDTKGVMPEFSMKGPANRATLAGLIYAFKQSVTEGASSPYSKVLVFPTTQPDFSASAGKMHTIIQRHQDASYSHKMIDCIAKKLTFSLKRNELLQVGVDWVSRGALSAVSNPSGTWTLPAFNPYAFEDLARTTVNFGSGAQSLILEEIEIMEEQEIRPVGGASALFANYGIINRKGTVKAKFLYENAQFASAKSNLQAGTALTFNLGWGNATPGTVDGDLDFTITGKLTAAPQAFDDLLFMEFSANILAASASTQGCTITMADAVDKGW